MRCPHPEAPDKCCHGYNGAPFKDGLANEDDDCDEILRKMVEEAKAPQKMVLWRRSYVVGFVTATIVWLFVMGRFPNWVQFYITIFLAAAVVYHTWSYYNFHVYDFQRLAMQRNVDILKRKCLS